MARLTQLQIGIICFTICMLSMVTADYILQVRTHYYNNPHNRLANGDCCRTPLVIFTQVRCASCNNRFYYCLQSIDSTRSDCTGGITSDNSNEDIQFSNPTLLGLPNPLPLQGLTRQWNGIQFVLEVRHVKSKDDNGELIGNVIYDIPYKSFFLGTESGQISFSFGINITLSFKVVCAENYYDQDCSRFCTENCTCDTGFTGEFCHKADNCLGVDCSGHGRCVHKIDNYTCICNPGYTGVNCDVDIVEHNTENTGGSQNLIALLGGIIGVLSILLLIVLIVAFIRYLKKKGTKLTLSSSNESPELINEESEMHKAEYSLETGVNVCYGVVPEKDTRNGDAPMCTTSEQMQDDTYLYI